MPSIRRGAGFSFDSRITADKIPPEFLEAIQRGVRDSLDSGPLVGFPLVDLNVQAVTVPFEFDGNRFTVELQIASSG